MVLEFGLFKRKSRETIDQVSERYNHMFSRMIKYDLERSLVEKKVTFLQVLHPDSNVIISNVKIHEQFKSYKLSQVVGILKSHEDEVIEGVKSNIGVGPLALVARRKNSKEKVVVDNFDSDARDDEFTSEEKAFMVCNPNKFFKKKISKFRGSGNAMTGGGGIGYKGGNSYGEKNKSEGVKNYQEDKEKGG